MADPVAADIEEIGDFVAARPVAQHLGLHGGFAVLGRGHMIDDRLDLAAVENPVLAAPDEIGDGHRGGDFVAENPVEVEHLGPGERLIPQVGGKNLFGNMSSPYFSFEFKSAGGRLILAKVSRPAKPFGSRSRWRDGRAVPPSKSRIGIFRAERWCA